MRICIDISPAAHRKAGLGRHARELAERAHRLDILNDYTLFTYQPSRGQVPPSLAHLPTYSVPWPAKPWRMSVLLAHYARVPQDGLVPGVALFHGTDHLLPYFRRIRTVFTLHDLIPLLFPEFHLPLNRWFLNLMFPRFLRRADAIVAVSECTKKDAIRIYGTPEEKITVIYNGVDASAFQVPAETRAEVRRELGLGGEDYVLLFCGSGFRRKGLRYAVAAVDAVPRARLLVAGQGRGPAHPRVRYLGRRPDVARLYAAADALILPTLYDPFPNACLEAMAAGRPVIVSRIAGVSEIIEGDSVVVEEPRDTAALAAAVRSLEDPALRGALGEAARRRALQFTPARHLEENLRLYAALVDKGRDSP